MLFANISTSIQFALVTIPNLLYFFISQTYILEEKSTMLLHGVWFSWASLSGYLGSLGLGIISLVIYRRYFMPLKTVPGPFLASFTRLWHIRQIAAGNLNLQLAKLHDEHGESYSIPLHD